MSVPVADVESVWRENGWAERLGWSVPERALIFSLRLPASWQHTPLPIGSRPGTTDSPIVRLREWVGTGTAIMLTGLIRRLPRSNGGSVLVVASMAATLVSERDLAVAADGRARRLRDCALPGAVEIVTTQRLQTPLADDPIEVLLARYFFDTEHGTLALLCTAPQAFFAEPLGEMFRAVAQTVRLDPLGSPGR